MTLNGERSSFFEQLRTGLEEGIRFARGELSLRTTVLFAPPPELEPKDIVELRQRLNLSQNAFACTLNVSAKTVQSWEQGIRKPSQAALRLLQLLAARPELLEEVSNAADAGMRSARATKPRRAGKR